VHLFELGDFPAPAQRQADSSRALPKKRRGENPAFFLGVLSLQYTRKTAKAAAQRYLQAYPSGFRHAGAARLSTSH
jgi:hypothetical protein